MRDCENCKHHTDNGCSSWECKFEPKGMTREEAIKHGKEQLEIFGGEHREFIELAIKALEQEPILDKIREEVNKLFVSLGDGSEEWRSCVNETVLEVLQILDKYKADRSEE